MTQTEIKTEKIESIRSKEDEQEIEGYEIEVQQSSHKKSDSIRSIDNISKKETTVAFQPYNEQKSKMNIIENYSSPSIAPLSKRGQKP